MGQDKNTRPAALTEALRRLLEETVDEAARTMRRIGRGQDYEAWEAALPSGRRLIVRLVTAGAVSLADEAWAIEQAREAGVPVPAVRTLQDIATERGPRPAMVQDMASGEPLSDVAASLTEAFRGRAQEEAGAMLRQMHGIPAGGFWQRHDGRWDFPTWEAFMEVMRRDRGRERPLYRAAGFTEEEVARMVRALDRLADEHRYPTPVLCHGDFVSEHVYVDPTGHVTALIDLGSFHGGAGLGDLALALEDPLWDSPAFLSGYYGHPIPVGYREPAVRLHALASAMGHLGYAMKPGKTEEIRRYTARLHQRMRDVDHILS